MGGGRGSAPVHKDWRYTLRTPQEMAQQSLQKNANFGQAITLGGEDYNKKVEEYTSKYNLAEQQKQAEIENKRQAEEKGERVERPVYSVSDTAGMMTKRNGSAGNLSPYSKSYVVNTNSKDYKKGKNPGNNNFYYKNLGADWFKKEAVSSASQSDVKLENRKNAITDPVEMKGADDIEISDKTSKTRAGIKGSATKQAVGTNKSINPSKTGLKL